MYVQSLLRRGNTVPFPSFDPERHFMRKFTKGEGLPDDLSRWQPTVDAMLCGVDTANPIYITIDQRVVPAGETQRKPGVHIDGVWNDPDEMQADQFRGWGTPPNWSMPGGKAARGDGIILASTHLGCAGYIGRWDINLLGEKGDCSKVNLNNMRRVEMIPHRAFSGNVTMIHEPIPMERDTPRSLVRLIVKDWSPE